MPKSAAALVVVLLLQAHSALAQSGGPIGAGALQCSEYLSQRAGQAERDVSAQWASGLIVGKLSAAGHYIPDQLTVHEVAAKLEEYCTRNTSHQVVLAALTLAREYQSRP